MSEQSTEQYQAAYDAEMAKLDKEAEKSITDLDKPVEPVAKVEDNPEAVQTEDAVATAEADRLAALQTRLESAEKALKDTKVWAHQSAAEVKQLRREQEEQKRANNRPEMLEANPGLEDAIRHVAGTPVRTPMAPPQEVWLDTVSAALPDLEGLLAGSDEFRVLAEQKRSAMGAEWNDPIKATRELGKLQADFQSKQAVEKAVSEARKDFALKQKKSTAMQMPGGGGSKAAQASVSEAERITSMSSADFNAMRSKTLGY